ncbi:unnamed protein product [Ectocarpus sp. 6 AP-2014]
MECSTPGLDVGGLDLVAKTRLYRRTPPQRPIDRPPEEQQQNKPQARKRNIRELSGLSDTRVAKLRQLCDLGCTLVA